MSSMKAPAYVVRGGQLYRIVADHLGTPRLVINVATGAVADRLDLDESGRVQAHLTPDFLPFGFASGLTDSDTGLIRFGARDYEPTTGRWTSKEAQVFVGSTNVYEYALSDPVNHVDVDGRQSVPFPWGAVGAGAAAGAAFGGALGALAGAAAACLFLTGMNRTNRTAAARSEINAFKTAIRNLSGAANGRFVNVSGLARRPMGARSERGYREAVHDALTRVDSQLNEMLADVSSCTVPERNFVEHHVTHIRRQLIELGRAQLDGNALSAGEFERNDPVAPLMGRAATEALLLGTRRIRRILEEQVLPWCRTLDGTVSGPLKGLGNALAAIYSLEFPLEAQHPDLSDKGPGETG